MNFGIRPTLILAGVLAVGIAPAVQAQSIVQYNLTLDNVVASYLVNQCANLQFDPADPLWGPNLSVICGYPSGVGSSSGGGSASPQASSVSVQNSVIQERLERAKSKGDHVSSPSVTGVTRGRSGSGRAEGPDPGTVSASSSSHRFDIFASGSYESLDRTVTPFEDGYDSSVLGGAFGFDFQFNDKFVAGVVAGYRRQHADFKGGGDFKMTAIEPSIFVSVLPSQKTFLQFVVGYGGQNSDVNRHAHFEVDSGGSVTSADGTAASSADSKALSASAQFGFDQPAGRFTFGPRVGVNYGRTKIDPYTETGGSGLELRFNERTVKSFQAVAGFYGSWALSTKSGVVLPQFNVQYIHEFENDPTLVTAQFAEDLHGPTAITFPFLTGAPDADFFNAEVGVAAVFARGTQFFVNVRGMLANQNFDNIGGTIGVRFEL